MVWQAILQTAGVSLLLATYTMGARLSLRVEHSFIAWLTYCVLSDVMTIQFVWTRNSVWTWLGGTNFSKVGMGSATSWCQNGLFFLVSKFHLTPQALWAMVPSSTTSGFVVHGQHHHNPCLLHIRNSFPLLWLRIILWGPHGPQGGSSSCMTMSWWWLLCLLAPLEILT